MTRQPNPSFELRLRVLAAVDYQPGSTVRARIKHAAEQPFVDPHSGLSYRFTWRTISTWLYRYKCHGVATLEPKVRSDKYTFRKVALSELAEAVHEVLPTLGRNKQGQLPKSVLYRQLLAKGFFTRTQLAPTTFYRMLREHTLLDTEVTQKLRQSFAMAHANELWQADTMHGPTIKQPDGSWQKTFLIAFIDDASRLITHAEFFARDNTENMVSAFRTALFKRGKPERLYFDNGSNYSSKEILQACVRLDIRLCHAPVRDGAAKGKIERFFRGFRDRFLTLHLAFDSLADLNAKTHQWIEGEYNTQHHSGIQMTPIDRFNLDRTRLQFIANDQFTAEVFFVELDRKVNKTNTLSLHKQRFECPVDLRGKTVQVRYDRHACRDGNDAAPRKVIVYCAGQRLGEASVLDLQLNAMGRRKHGSVNTSALAPVNTPTAETQR